MSSTHVQIVKWTFPAFALIIGLFWYKRRRVDRADPGGIITRSNDQSETLGTGDCKTKEAAAAEPCEVNSTANLCDSGIHIDESFSLNAVDQRQEVQQQSPDDEPVVFCSPRKVSESLDIPTRKSTSEPISMQSASPDDDKAWYEDVDAIPATLEVQLGSNPKMSNFEMIARSRNASSPFVDSSRDAIEDGGEVVKIFDEPVEEKEQQLFATSNGPTECEVESTSAGNASDANDRCAYSETNEQPVGNSSENDNKAQVPPRVLSERDSANHSPVSGVLEGSVTDEARSEGSTDSGKGGSIRGHAKYTPLRMTYEFNIPQGLVGRLIGSQGSFIQTIRTQADVRISIKGHSSSRELKTCCIKGTTDAINVALDLIRQRFPEEKYMYLTLEQVLPTKIPEEIPWVPELVQLSLVERVNNDVLVCYVEKPNRLFLQLPTHPTFPLLRVLDTNMSMLYNTAESLPVPDPLKKGMIVVAKWYNRWVRVCVETPDPQGEQNVVRLLDYGGYWTFSNSAMRNIRFDHLTLPFQAIEVFLANVQPTDGEWKQEAYDVVVQMCSGNVGQAQIEGYIDTKTYVNLYLNLYKHGVISLADELITRGFAESVPLEGIVPEDTPVL